MKTYKKRGIKRIFHSILAIILVIAMELSPIAQTGLSALVTKTASAANNKVNTSKTVATQAQLTKALADKSIETITIRTSSAKKFTVPDKVYKAKKLVINAPKATIINNGEFENLVVTNAIAITENVKGNSITVNDKKVTINITKEAEVKLLTLTGINATYAITANGVINKVILSKKGKVTITGTAFKNIPLQINEAAKASDITSSIPLKVQTAVDISITLKKGAEGSTATISNKTANIKLTNSTTKSVIINTPEGKKVVKAGTKIDPTGTPEKPEVIDKEPTKTPIANEGSNGINNGKIDYYTVNFNSNGGTEVEKLIVGAGSRISDLPTPQKDNCIFLGWYSDTSLQVKFLADTTINSTITLYAKYAEFEVEQENLDDSYTLIEQAPGLMFTITSTDISMTADSVKGALALTIADGSETVDLFVEGEHGTYTVSGISGFTEGASFILTLKDSKLNFKDQASNIRNCSFTIAKAEVYNIELKDGIVYIPQSSISNMTKNGAQVESLSVPVTELTNTGSGDATVNGTFTYIGSTTLNPGDILCIYSGDKPETPSGNEGDAGYMDDEIAYIKVATIIGSTGSQSVEYSDAEAEEVLFTPDVLPIAIDNTTQITSYTAAEGNTAGVVGVVISSIDFSVYSDMGLSAETTIDVGDYLAFYTGKFNDSSNAASVVYGKVGDITGNDDNVTISFTTTTEEEMQEVLDYFSKNDVDGATLIEGVDVAALEGEIEQQVQESGFADDVSEYMTALAMETDGFKKIAGEEMNLETLSLKLADGTDASLEDMQIMSLSTSSRVSIENLKVKANISKSLQKLSGSGLRCAVTVSFDVPITTGDDSEIRISLSASFAEELKLEVNTSGKAIWKKKWIFPYIADYQMNANIDVYNYTGINFKATVSSKSTEAINISEEIQNILSYTNSEQITTGVQELFEIYSEMMENETDWIEIFSQNITESKQSLLLGIIQIKTSVDFVVSADINVALGCNFEYKSGTRYCFWAKIGAKDAGSSSLDLMDEEYTFQFYAMGALGLRAGIKLEFAVGLFSVDLNSVGLTAEAGVYTRLYGYFFYNLESVNKIKNSRMSGALYMELGIYLEIAFKAQVLNGKFQYNPTLYENEWPLLTAGTKYNVYNFAYDQTSSTIKLKDSVKTYTLPDNTFSMTYLDLKEGDISTKNYKVTDYGVTFTNPNFSLTGNTVLVNVPKGTHELASDMIVAWKSSPLAFSSVPMTRTFHLVWDDLNDNGYTITYNTNGGSAVSSVTKKYKSAVTAPIAPIKNGYTFAGWYNNANLTTEYTFSTMPAENIVLYAKWTANTNTKYKVERYQQNLTNDNYTLYETETLTGVTGTAAIAPAKAYVGFTYNGGINGTISSGTIAADGSLILKQYYSCNSYILTFKPANGGSDIVKTLKYGASISTPIVVKTGFNFIGWDSTVEVSMPAANTIYTAQWTINNYSIEFNTNGGTAVNKITQAYGTTVIAPAAPTKNGETFEGWYRDSNLTKPYVFNTITDENVILYAKWNTNANITYKVEHYQQNKTEEGYTLKDTENLTGAYNIMVTANVKNYEGFAYNSSVPGTLSSGLVAANGSLVLKLYYSRNTYSISFNSNEGSNVEQITQKYGTVASAPISPTRTGYIFAGWFSNSGLTTEYTFTTMPAGDITLFAKWDAITTAAYKVEYYQQNLVDEDYTLYETTNFTGTIGNSVTAEENSYTGFRYNPTNPNTVTSGNITANGSFTMRMYYDRNSYSLLFMPENGGEDNENVVKYGATISAPTIPTKTNCTFVGWYREEALNNAYTFSTMPAEDVTLYAKWTINTENGERLEGEYGIIYGGRAEIEYTPNASNGMNVGYLDMNGAGVSFPNLEACTSILLAYASETTGTASIYVNGVHIGNIYLSDTGSYQTYAIIKIVGLNLKDGDTLSFQHDFDDIAFNVDYIAYNSGTDPIVTIPIQ